MKEDFFENEMGEVVMGPGAVLLKGFARKIDRPLIAAINMIAPKAPFRQMITPGGFRMSVAMTNCGNVGWATDLSGYCYQEIDPESGQVWPLMPNLFMELAT